jgi:hypothetical protein
MRWSLARDESGRAGPAILLGLVGLVVGAPAGFLTGGVLAQITVCRVNDGSLGAGESCGMAALIFALLGFLIGAVVGAVAGAIVGGRRPRAQEVTREASPLAALAVVGGIAIAYGAFAGWRTVWIPYEHLDRYGGMLAPGPEGIAFLGGLIVLAGGTLSVLRPRGSAPPIVVAIGTALAIAAALWAYVDLLGVPSELQRQIFVGYWVSVAGATVAAAGWFVQRRRRAVD